MIVQLNAPVTSPSRKEPLAPVDINNPIICMALHVKYKIQFSRYNSFGNDRRLMTERLWIHLPVELLCAASAYSVPLAHCAITVSSSFIVRNV
jgi:hypothetical protein